VVVPSQWEEPFGLVAVEAMAAGVPPVAPAHGSFPEIISHDVDGMLYPPGSASGLAQVIRDVEAHPERYEGLGRAARQTYQARFTPEPIIEQLLGIYHFALEHPAC
jgi:glycosyltransferase involved in cell wall biosynthesis